MKLTLLGTGCPSIDYKRCGASNLVSTKKTKILIDCGSGVTQRLNQSKNSSADIDALLLTHLHTDHVIDLYQLIISSWHSDRTSQWKIYGPRGTKKFCENLFVGGAFDQDIKARSQLGRRQENFFAVEPEVTEYEPGEIYKDDLITVTAVQVYHVDSEIMP